MPLFTQIVDDPFPLADLSEVNHCHGPGRGHPCVGRTAQPSTLAKTARPLTTKGTSYARPKVLRTTDLGEAVKAILAGKVIELVDTKAVNTLLHKLADMAQEAARLGKDAPEYDLCKVTVKGTNIFCGDMVRTKQFPNGIPRIKMPQLKGFPEPGSKADALRRTKTGKVDATKAFLEHLETLGIKSERLKIKASKLKASQREIVGSRIAARMKEKKYWKRNKSRRIFVSRDNYIIDGHHHWATTVGLDAGDAKLGDLKVRVFRVDAPIAEVLKIANNFTKRYGLRRSAGVARAA